MSYGATSVLRGIDFALGGGQTLALLGSSGSGKTTLLRLIAGLLVPDKGRIIFGDMTVADAENRIFVPPERRGLGMVFQDYALWPHLSVGRNISFPLEMRGMARAERDERTRKALDKVGLTGLADRQPSQLSGGQQQRVAIARAIVAEPKLILFDEPLSNLDRRRREIMLGEIGLLIRSLGLTAIYVTHDHNEALSLADQVAVMRAGHIEQLAAPEVLINHPASPNVAEFLGLGCVAPVELRDAAWWLAGSGISVANDHEVSAPGDATHVLLPTKSIEVAETAVSPLTGTVLRSRFRGDGHLTTVRLERPENPLELQLVSVAKLYPGDQVGLQINPRHVRWFSK
ncbi:MAG TPA: ABC transporter ATP-binding protein [Stellaceae bacterium]|nr:ABC transporter ATP-binding protein [Stellaceae bacterium]